MGELHCFLAPLVDPYDKFELVLPWWLEKRGNVWSALLKKWCAAVAPKCGLRGRMSGSLHDALHDSMHDS